MLPSLCALGQGGVLHFNRPPESLQPAPELRGALQRCRAITVASEGAPRLGEPYELCASN